MKIATRIALLLWQANPVDPSNFMKLVVAWVTPGMREPAGSDDAPSLTSHVPSMIDGANGTPARSKPDRPSQAALRGFLAGMFTTIVVVGIAVLAWFWLHSTPMRSAEDQAIYDRCLVAQNGNAVTCDAFMRIIARGRTAEAAMLQQAAKLRAAGFTGCAIERWAADTGFVGSQLSEASGIPLNELQAGKCLSTEPTQK